MQPEPTPIACYRDPRAGGLRGAELRSAARFSRRRPAAPRPSPGLISCGPTAFRDFLDLANRGRASRPAGWPPLYRAAKAIGVNISALVRQLEAEGFVIVDRSGDRPLLHPQPGLGNLLLTGISP